jgi:hypothetical protein
MAGRCYHTLSIGATFGHSVIVVSLTEVAGAATDRLGDLGKIHIERDFSAPGGKDGNPRHGVGVQISVRRVNVTHPETATRNS